MCRISTIRALAFALLSTAVIASAQEARPEWRHFGSSALDGGLPSVATGAVDRVWYSADGSSLNILTRSRRQFVTNDFEQWRTAGGSVPNPDPVAANVHLPETGLKIRRAATDAGRLYAFGAQVYRSDDGGVTWSNITGYRGASVLGGDVADLAVSPANADELTAVNAHGVWRTLDGGLTWTGLNDALPNLPLRTLVAAPNGLHGLRAVADGQEQAWEWFPGEKIAWRKAGISAEARREADLRRTLSPVLGATITAAAVSGDYVYAGAADGRLWASSDQGRTWRPSGTANDDGPVERIFVDSREPSLALAALGVRTRVNPGSPKAAHVRRTTNGGIFWDDMTANLPDTATHGIAADLASGAVYAATDTGVWMAMEDLRGASPAANWTLVAGDFPVKRVWDVRLDPSGNQLFALVDGYGVYATIAPHVFRDVRVVSSADLTPRPAAPGGLLSVLGARISSARVSQAQIPVLAATDTASQIQVPFDAQGGALSLSFEAASGRFDRTVPLESVAPAIFLDPDGAPLILDAETGVLLDSMQPARGGSRLQVLATGLGRVAPAWPAGVAAPLANVPRVIAPVQVLLNGQPVEVTKATLAPGYIGLYLIEIQLPRVVNAGPADLSIEAGSQTSNHVRVPLEP